MTCRKCNAALVEGAAFCHRCGAAVNPKPRASRCRTNHTGSVWKDPASGKWTVQVTLGMWVDQSTGRIWRKYATRKGLKTRAEAERIVLELLQQQNPQRKNDTVMDVY